MAKEAHSGELSDALMYDGIIALCYCSQPQDNIKEALCIFNSLEPLSFNGVIKPLCNS